MAMTSLTAGPSNDAFDHDLERGRPPSIKPRAHDYAYDYNQDHDHAYDQTHFSTSTSSPAPLLAYRDPPRPSTPSSTASTHSHRSAISPSPSPSPSRSQSLSTRPTTIFYSSDPTSDPALEPVSYPSLHPTQSPFDPAATAALEANAAPAIPPDVLPAPPGIAPADGTAAWESGGGGAGRNYGTVGPQAPIRSMREAHAAVAGHGTPLLVRVERASVVGEEQLRGGPGRWRVTTRWGRGRGRGRGWGRGRAREMEGETERERGRGHRCAGCCVWTAGALGKALVAVCVTLIVVDFLVELVVNHRQESLV